MFYMYFLSIQNNKYHYIWCKLIHLQDCAYEVTRLIPSLNDHLAFIIKTPIPPMKYIQDMFHVTWLSALQNGSDFCVSTEMSLSQQSIYKMPLLYTSTFVYKHNEDFEVGSHFYFDEYNSLPQLHASCFHRGLKLIKLKKDFTFKFL